MLLAIDVGNTTLNIGVFEEEKLLFVATISKEQGKTAVSQAIDLRNIFELYKVDYTSIDGAVISSVVPEYSNVLVKAIEICCNISPMQVGPGIKTGLNIKIDNPAQVGADLVACAVGAVEKYPLPCVIYDLGTATTISVISNDGLFLGGVIYPGMRISLRALEEKTALLPHIAMEIPKNIIGSNTIDAMQSGIIYGTVAVLDGFADKIERQLGMPCTHVATGGLSGTIYKLCAKEFIYNPHLIFEGLRIIYNKNLSLN